MIRTAPFQTVLLTLAGASALALLCTAAPLPIPTGENATPPGESDDGIVSMQKTEPGVAVRHRGPTVAEGEAGPMRFVPSLYAAFDSERAMKTVAFADGFYRAPRGDGYEATLDHIAAKLRSVGFGEEDGLELTMIASPQEQPAWTAVSASIGRMLPNGTKETLHSFDEPSSTHRNMLPVGAPPCDLTGEAVFHLDEVIHGKILVTEAPASPFLLRRARMRGAVAILSASLGGFNIDPTGAGRHLDAIQYRRLKGGSKLPVFQISPRTLKDLQDLSEAGETLDLELKAVVKFDERPLRTLVACVVGDTFPDEAVPIVSHVQEPGACDNASGLSGLLESVMGFVTLLKDGTLHRPVRTMVFVWGDEFRQSSEWLENTERKPIVAISSDMTGESAERTGAIALLERMPDPGALIPLEPDFHTPWGAGEVDPESLAPNGFAVIGRCAMADVNRVVGGTWQTGDHPWEGGSDHDTFIAADVPACLFWHFTDFTYHTSLDRIEFVDPEEMRRTGTAILATALSVADPHPEDLERYLPTVEIERELRVSMANAAGDAKLAERWSDWCQGSIGWLKALCDSKASATHPASENK